MRVYWNEAAIPAAVQALIEGALAACAEHENAPAGCEVSVSMVSLEEMRVLNRDYRGIDNETDVLSFPGFPNSPALGDIVISPDVAERQAREYGHSLEREMAFLAVHGLLHLLGHEHDTPKGEAAMCAAQEKILRIIGVER